MTAAIEKSLPYDPIKDFTHIAKVATGGLALVVNPEVLPVKSVAELVAVARSQPGKLNFASAGNGSQPHLAVEVLKQKFGIDMLHVPHKGQAQAVTELLAGRIHLMMLPVHTALPYVASGKLRVLAVPGKMRARFAPDLPTFAEVGLPEVLAELYYWVAAPANTPKEITSKLNQALASLMARPEVKESLLKQGLVTETSAQDDTTRQIGQDIEWWKKFVTEAKLAE
jgi:tripartite-type tricarboxylate transporter receptor subunit TctC